MKSAAAQRLIENSNQDESRTLAIHFDYFTDGGECRGKLQKVSNNWLRLKEDYYEWGDANKKGFSWWKINQRPLLWLIIINFYFIQNLTTENKKNFQLIVSSYSPPPKVKFLQNGNFIINPNLS